MGMPFLTARNAGWTSVGVAVFALILLTPFLEYPMIHRQQELRVALAAREMAEGGSWLVPYYQGKPRLRKPPLMYWLVAASYKAAGTTASATVARLPSAAAGAALIVLMYLGGRRLVGSGPALVSAVAGATSMQFLQLARSAETEILQVLFLTGSGLCVYRALTATEKRAAWWVGAAICSGLGFMSKGPAPVLFPFLAALVFQFGTRSAARPRLPVQHLILYLAVVAIIVLPWYIAVRQHPVPEAAVTGEARDEIARLLTTSRHTGPLYYYVYTLPFELAPWGLLLPFAVHWAWKRRRHHAGVRFLLGWLAAIFVVLSLLASKQGHYALLMFPPALWLVGLYLHQRLWRPAQASRTHHGVVWFLLLLSGLLTAAGVLLGMLPLFQKEAPGGLGLLYGMLVVGPGVLAAAFWRRREPRKLFVLTALQVGLLFQGATRLVLPVYEYAEVIPSFVRQAAGLIPDAPRIIHVGQHEATVRFYLNRPVQHFGQQADVWPVARAGDAILLVRVHPPEVERLRWPADPELRAVRGNVECRLYRAPNANARAGIEPE
jgi:4-amino-4-deoxy-L-arabinose transferase-like glycosyltransferase